MDALCLSARARVHHPMARERLTRTPPPAACGFDSPSRLPRRGRRQRSISIFKSASMLPEDPALPRPRLRRGSAGRRLGWPRARGMPPGRRRAAWPPAPARGRPSRSQLPPAEAVTRTRQGPRAAVDLAPAAARLSVPEKIARLSVPETCGLKHIHAMRRVRAGTLCASAPSPGHPGHPGPGRVNFCLGPP